MTLIHPNGVDLMSYEKRLEEQVRKYQARLSQLAWTAIPADRRGAVLDECGLGEGQTPSYSEHRTILHRVLNELHWPHPKLNFDLLEEEIQQAETFLRYSRSLREEAKKPLQDSGSLMSGGSHVPLMDNPLTSMLKKGRSSKPSKSAKVIVRSKVDGFYYPGVVTSVPNGKLTTVRLADRQEISAHSSLVIPVGGARPCPLLRYGDHALVRVRTSRNGCHPGSDGQCDYYIPGVVQVLPANERKGHALHSILVFNGRVVTCDRRGIVKITEKRYSDTCKFIRQRVGDGTEPTESEESRSEISYTYSSRSSVCMPTPPDSDQESEASSVCSHSQDRSVRSKSRASSASSTHEPVSNGLDLSSLVETQRAQEEVIQQYRKELLAMQEKQKELEEQLVASLSKDQPQPSSVDQPRSETTVDVSSIQEVHAQDDIVAEKKSDAGGTGDDLDDFPDNGVKQEVDAIEASQVLSTCTAATENSHELYPPVRHVEAGVNTDVMTEDRGVGTGPMTESVAVGTEWSQSESESSDEADIGSESINSGTNRSVTESPVEDEIPVQTTPIPTPVPTPPLSRVPTPEHATPVPSKNNTPQHTKPPTPPQSLTSTPSHNHVSISSHSHHDSPTHDSPIRPTPQITPVHVPYEVAPLINQQVLARWPDDGWYYRCTVVGGAGEGQWEVEDASGDTEVIPLGDIITDLADSQKSLQVSYR